MLSLHHSGRYLIKPAWRRSLTIIASRNTVADFCGDGGEVKRPVLVLGKVLPVAVATDDDVEFLGGRLRGVHIRTTALAGFVDVDLPVHVHPVYDEVGRATSYDVTDDACVTSRTQRDGGGDVVVDPGTVGLLGIFLGLTGPVSLGYLEVIG